MKFAFGMIIGADFLPKTRVMAIGPALSAAPMGHRVGPPDRVNWWAIVLRDESLSGDRWQPGDLITLAEDNAGLRMIDEEDDT